MSSPKKPTSFRTLWDFRPNQLLDFLHDGYKTAWIEDYQPFHADVEDLSDPDAWEWKWCKMDNRMFKCGDLFRKLNHLTRVRISTRRDGSWVALTDVRVSVKMLTDRKFVSKLLTGRKMQENKAHYVQFSDGEFEWYYEDVEISRVHHLVHLFKKHLLAFNSYRIGVIEKEVDEQ